MRESCQCGGFIASLRRRDVREWRDNHIHEGRPEPEPDKNGAEARVEHFGNRNFEHFGPDGYGVDHPIVIVKTGFQPGGR